MSYTPQDWLPTTAKEVQALGWDYIDVILFSGDAYVDHPSFGAAVIGRILQSEGYRVAIVPQPNWRDDLRDFKKLGTPRMFFGVTAGSMDSMVNHYTANIRLRSDDSYTPGGKAGFRPDYAVSVYSRILKELFPHVPVVAGGIESSLRRLTHYDYWSNSLKPSLLTWSGADVLMYGMGDKSILDVAKALRNGFNMNLLRKLPQVAFLADDAYVEKLDPAKTLVLNSFEECVADKGKFGENFVTVETESNRLVQGKTIVERTEDKWTVINPPYPTLSTEELDRSFALPYTRMPHPRYNGKGDISAYEMIKHSVNIHRGCFGGCSFCTISAHQGKFITSRSKRSIVAELEKVTTMPDFKGYISDLGGPSANMYSMGGRNRSLCARCTRPSCLWPAMCPNLDNDHTTLLEIYRAAAGVKGIKKTFVSSGIRYDLFDRTDGGRYLAEVVEHHTSGRLKVAPEHTEERVLKFMRKPTFDLFTELNTDFKNICARKGLKYQLIPYFISSHPGCTEQDMAALSRKMKGLNFHLEQVQDLTPTPMTLSSVMFYTGMDPYTGEKLYVARNQDEKRRQKSYFFDGPGRAESYRHKDAPKRADNSRHTASSGRTDNSQRTGKPHSPAGKNAPSRTVTKKKEAANRSFAEKNDDANQRPATDKKRR